MKMQSTEYMGDCRYSRIIGRETGQKKGRLAVGACLLPLGRNDRSFAAEPSSIIASSHLSLSLLFPSPPLHHPSPFLGTPSTIPPP